MPDRASMDPDEALADWDRQLTLAAALAFTEKVLADLPELVLAEKERAGLEWRQISLEVGLPLVTIWNIAHRKRDGQRHSLLRIVSWLKVRTQPDPSHGQIDLDIRAKVNGMQPANLAQRTAIENTLQSARDHVKGKAR